MTGAWNSLLEELKLNRSTSALFLLALGLFVGVRIWNLTATPLNFDEIFSVHAVRHDWSGLIAFVRRDLVHPPLFYALLKIWVGIGGESLLWLRLFPTLIALVSIFPLLQLCRELNLRPTERNVAVVLIAVNGFLLYYSRFLRMYTLLLLLSLCSLWLFVRLVKSPVIPKLLLLALFIVNVLLIYTHYFGWFLITAEFLCLVSRPAGEPASNLIPGSSRGSRGSGLGSLSLESGKLLGFLLSAIVLAILFSLWVYAVVEVYRERGLSHNLSWAARPHLGSLISFYTDLNGPYGHPFAFAWSQAVGLFLFGCPIFIWGCQVFLTRLGRDWRDARTFWVLFLFGFLPVALVYFASRLTSQSIWLPRGLSFVAVPYLILVAVAVSRLRPRWVGIGMLLMSLGWATLAGFHTLSREEKTRIRIDNWVREMIQSESGTTNSVKIYTLDEDLAYFIWFHLGTKNESRFQIVEVKGLGPQRPAYWLTREMFRSVTVDELIDLEGEHFWVAFKHQRWPQKRTPQEIFSDAGYRLGKGFEGGHEHSRTDLFPVWR